jgi:hypothetical protein
MAKKVIVTHQAIDDLDGKELGPEDDGKTVHWSIEGEHLEMELSEANRQLFLADMEKWRRISRPDGAPRRKDEAAKPISTTTGPLGELLPDAKRVAPQGKKAKAAPTGKAKRDKTRWRVGIRTWAAENGIDCPATGRVPRTVTDAWDRAHPKEAAAIHKKVAAAKGAKEHDLLSMDEDSEDAAA